MTTLIENAIPDAQLSITELTEATLDGSGVLDVLLQTMRLHLDREFKSNRITGTAYATVYAESMAVFLQQAIQYTLSKSRMALELQQLEEQVALVKLQQDQTVAQTNKIATDTVVAIKQGHLIDAQTCQVKAQTNQINAETALKLPAEVAKIGADTANQTKQTELLQYELLNIKPQQLALATKEVALKDKQIEVSIADLALKGKQLDLATYEVTTKLPAEVASVQAQTALYTQKTTTERAQTDNSVVGADSVVDIQNKMLAAQTSGFQRDAEQKAAQLLINTWNVRNNADPDTNDVNLNNKLVDNNVGAAVQKLMAGINVIV